MKKVSVIVPVYNVEKYLEKCIKSICNQTYKNIEIILVDDGSTDFSSEICDNYAKKDQRIQVIHKENGGLADARNTGIQKVLGDYLLFIDSDDWIHEELINHTVHTAEKTDADIVMFDYVGVKNDGKICSTFTIDIESNKIISVSEEPRLVMASCSAVNKLYKTSFWKNAGLSFPKGRYYEDLGTIPKLMALAKKVVYQKEVLYYYLMRDGSIMRSSDFSRNYVDRTAVLDSVLEFYKENDLWDSYKSELEYLVFENGYYFPSREIVLNNKKSVYLDKFREYAYNRFPDLEQNDYIKDMSNKDKILWMLLRKRQYSGMIILSHIRRLRDFIKGEK